MSTCTEIETKLCVNDHESVRKQLQYLHAVYIELQQQTDIYFDDASASLTKSDTCLRLRVQNTDKNQTCILTYKGPKHQACVKKRTEIELTVDNQSKAIEFVGALGYKESLTVEKTRELWQYKNCDIALDQVKDIGNYVEIEGPDETVIMQIKRELALTEYPHIQQSYASLLAKQRNSHTYNES